MIAVFLLSVTLTFADSTQSFYAQQDAEGLRSLMAQAETRTDSLMARYRLYPLTEDSDVIDDIPQELGPNASARELALLSGLWAYRAGEANIFSAIRYGRRSVNRLEEAKARDPDEPYVLLVEGQSLLFRPDVAGKDVAGAAKLFRRLINELEDHPNVGISSTEAHSWLWLALREAESAEEADQIRSELIARDPEPLYAQFLEDPPQV